MIVVNFKRYPQSSAAAAVKLAQICKQVGQECGVRIIPVPQIQDIAACAAEGVDCWTQKFEPEHTLQKGTLLNHSDFRLERAALQEELYLSKTRGDETCVCTANPEETAELTSTRPNFLAYEPPELIGSTTTSVAQSKPEDITRAADICRRTNIQLLVGAGIKSAADVRVSLDRGSVGVLIASAVVLASDQEKELRELAMAFKR